MTDMDKKISERKTKNLASLPEFIPLTGLRLSIRFSSHTNVTPSFNEFYNEVDTTL